MFVIAALLVVDKRIGRRPMLLYSAAIMSFAQCVIAVCFVLKDVWRQPAMAIVGKSPCPYAHWYTHTGIRTLVYAHWYTHTGIRTLVYAHWYTHTGIVHLPFLGPALIHCLFYSRDG
jgi:hypothetical protein